MSGDLLPEVDEAVTGLITTTIWFGITAGYLTLTGSHGIPARSRDGAEDRG
jgi:hypothetical protein